MLCKLSIAFSPNGVAALSNPNKLALKLSIINPKEGCPFGISGNNFEKKGCIIRLKRLIPPAFSAMLMNPMNKVIIPISPKHISTAVYAVPMIPLASCILKTFTFSSFSWY